MRKGSLLPLTMYLVGQLAMAQGDPAAGKTKATLCSSCHGADGRAIIEIYPNLAGQNRQYLESALRAYRDGVRSGGQASMMVMNAKLLSDEDIADISAYYAQMKVCP